MCKLIVVCVKDGERVGEMSSEQVAAMRDVETLTEEERRVCDVCGFVPLNRV